MPSLHSHDGLKNAADGANEKTASQAASPDDATVAKGELLLSLLNSQAAWARVEAQRAELELLLAEARDGDTLRLRQWLHSRPRSHPTAADRPQSGDLPIAPEAIAASQAAADEVNIASWDSLMPFARQRLANRCSELPSQEGRAGDGVENTASDVSANMESKPANEPAEAPREASTGASPGDPAALPAKSRSARPAAKRVDSKDVSRIARKTVPSAAVAGEDSPRHSSRRQRRKAPVFSNPVFSDRRGWAASILAHAALLIMLAVITLKMPSPPASLAIESTPTEIAPESLELMAPTESETPETQEPTPSSRPLEMPAELLQNRTALALPVSGVLDNVAVDSNSAPSAAALTVGSDALAAMQSGSSFFGAAANGNCFCYVIDSSLSMRGGPWEAAKAELLRSLASLQQTQRFYIIFFNRQLSAIPSPGTSEPAPRAMYANPDRLEHARRWIDTLEIAIGAPPNAALEMAIAKEPDAIYLLTDGVTQSDVATFLRQQNRVSDLIVGEQVRVPIHTIAFYSLEGQDLLQKIARENRGEFIYVPDPRKR